MVVVPVVGAVLVLISTAVLVLVGVTELEVEVGGAC